MPLATHRGPNAVSHKLSHTSTSTVQGCSGPGLSYAAPSYMPLPCTTREICIATAGDCQSCASGLNCPHLPQFPEMFVVSLCTGALHTDVYMLRASVISSITPRCLLNLLQRQVLGASRPQTVVRARQRPQRRPRQSEIAEPDAEPAVAESDGFSAAFDAELPATYAPMNLLPHAYTWMSLNPRSLCLCCVVSWQMRHHSLWAVALPLGSRSLQYRPRPVEPCRPAVVQPVEAAVSSQALQTRPEEASTRERAASGVSSSASTSATALTALTAEIVECREVDEILEVVSEEAGQSQANLLIPATYSVRVVQYVYCGKMLPPASACSDVR